MPSPPSPSFSATREFPDALIARVETREGGRSFSCFAVRSRLALIFSDGLPPTRFPCWWSARGEILLPDGSGHSAVFCGKEAAAARSAGASILEILVIPDFFPRDPPASERSGFLVSADPNPFGFHTFPESALRHIHIARALDARALIEAASSPAPSAPRLLRL